MDYVTKSIKMRADSGDLSAMLELGGKFARGDGVGRNLAKAEQYLLKAAESGDLTAQLELGKLYSESEKFEPWKAKCVLEKALAQGSDEACILIGLLYYNGAFDSYDYETAVKWLRQPAEKGNSEAQFYIGSSYFELNDDEKAFYWLKKAAEQNFAEAQYKYALYAADTDSETEQWLLKALENGYVHAYCALGRLYVYSDECRDYAKGVELLTAGAEKGIPDAMCSLAECYYDGEAVGRDLDKAFYWYNRAGKYNVFNYFGLGRCYLYGAGVKSNYKKAVKFLKKSMTKEALYELGNCYYNGWGVKQDNEEAEKLWRQSAEQGYKEAEKALEQYHVN